MKINALIYCCILMVCMGCKSYKTKYPYSLEDFRPELRGDLAKIIQSGVVGAPFKTENSEENYRISDLQKMFKSEHPLIRCFAFQGLIEKDSTNIRQLLLSSLDDTAVVSVYEGEWGVPRMYCSEYYIDKYFQQKNGKGNFKSVNQELLDPLIEKAPNLKNTLQAIAGIDTIAEKYYDRVRLIVNSAIANENTSNGANILTYDDDKVHVALYALSKFKKQKDISFIKENLRFNNPYYWEIIKNNPDSAYFSLVEEVYKQLKKANEISPKQLQIIFYGKRRNLIERFEDFLTAVAKFKNKKSAILLTDIINKELLPFNYYERNNFNSYKYTIYELLKENECKEYRPLINKLNEFYEPIYQKYKGSNKR